MGNPSTTDNGDEPGPMTQVIGTREWRRYGFGGPPEPWASGARQDLDRLSTSYYLDVLAARPRALTAAADEEMRARIEELFTTATRHKHEIDYTLRHWATPVERARGADRLGLSGRPPPPPQPSPPRRRR